MNAYDPRREENYQEYLRLLKDSNYHKVTFDEESGGVSAIHNKHKFDSDIGSYGIKIGEYEKRAVEVLRKRGHCIILESEIAANNVKTPDGTIDGRVMDIKATDKQGVWAIKTKLHNAAKQGAECVILYFHKKELFSNERMDDGWNRFLNDCDSQKYVDTIKQVICVVEDTVIEWDIK